MGDAGGNRRNAFVCRDEQTGTSVAQTGESKKKNIITTVSLEYSIFFSCLQEAEAGLLCGPRDATSSACEGRVFAVRRGGAPAALPGLP